MQFKLLILAGLAMGFFFFTPAKAQAETHFVVNIDPLSLLIGTRRHVVYHPSPRPLRPVYVYRPYYNGHHHHFHKHRDHRKHSFKVFRDKNHHWQRDRDYHSRDVNRRDRY